MHCFTAPRFFGRTMVATALLILSADAIALSYDARVTHVSDGDTVRATVAATCSEIACPAVGERLRIRLAEIDAPESDQPHGREATDSLSSKVGGRTVTVVQTDVDRYGRVVGNLIVNGVWINGWMVGEGQAWVYPKYAESPELYRWEDEARKAQRGLWSQDDPIAPWDWRHR